MIHLLIKQKLHYTKYLLLQSYIKSCEISIFVLKEGSKNILREGGIANLAVFALKIVSPNFFTWRYVACLYKS